MYWIQAYKLASAIRPEGPMVDNIGPWFFLSRWAAYWHNLNTQLALYTVHTTNHLEIGDVMCRWLERDRELLINNCPVEWRSDSASMGNPRGPSLSSAEPGGYFKDLGYRPISLAWLMQHCYLQYRFSMDDERMRTSFFPLLRRTYNFYLHILKLGDDGRYHMPRSWSDEYRPAVPELDCNLNLALARWGFQTLIELNGRLKMNDPYLPRWQETLDKLADYPVDPQDGLMIGKDVPLSKPHRHYSHLFAIFPLHVLNVDDQPGQKDMMIRSVRHWIYLKGDDCMFKYTGAASLFAALGLGDESLAVLNDGLEIKAQGPTITPNTLYRENHSPTFESPISAARSILDMLIQSWGHSIKIFPACPTAWKDVAFNDLRTEGAFLVSAKRKEGRTTFVRIKSLAGEPCRISCDLTEPIHLRSSGTVSMTHKGDVIELDLKKGDEAILFSGDSEGSFTVEPLPVAPANANAWGVHASLLGSPE
jgi:alpha-L-fucosidase 2